MVKIWEKQKYGKDMGKYMVKIWEKQKYSKALHFIILPFFFFFKLVSENTSTTVECSRTEFGSLFPHLCTAKPIN